MDGSNLSRSALPESGHSSRRGMGAGMVAIVLCGLALMTACSKTPTITVTNDFTPAFSCSGYIVVSGSGFTPNGQVQVSASSTQASPEVQNVWTVTADPSGTLGSGFKLGYAYAGGNGKAGCPSGSTPTQAATVGTADLKTGGVGFATVNNMCTAKVQWGVGPGLCP